MSEIREVALLGNLGLCRKRWSRFTISLDGRICNLRGKSFRYLFALATARHLHGDFGKLHYDDGWINKRDIEPGTNQTKYFYQLRQELKAACDGAQRLIENNGRGFYRLALQRGQICFDFDSLEDFPDPDVREMVEKLRREKDKWTRGKQSS